VAKLSPTPTRISTNTERAGPTPAQFLPSMMLSWRTPIMARHGLPMRFKVKARTSFSEEKEAKRLL
jgi:hypothetical protein